MEIWSFVNSKGGVGKSTLTVHIAHHLMSLGKEVCIVDADPQGSIRDWQEMGQVAQFSVIGLDRKQSLKTLQFVVNTNAYHYCLIDTPGKVSEIQSVAIALSDKVFIPVQPSSYDVWASSDIVELIHTRQEVANGAPKAAFIINRAIPNSNIGRDVVDALKAFDLHIIQQPITQRLCFSNTIAEGKTILSSNDRKAKLEIELVTNHMQCF